MRATMDRKTPARRASRSAAIGRVEAVVIDEKRNPVELVPGARTLRASRGELAIKADFPLLPGSHLLVQIGDRHASDAASKRFEVEVLGCKKWLRGHEVRTRLVEGTMPRELLRAA